MTAFSLFEEVVNNYLTWELSKPIIRSSVILDINQELEKFISKIREFVEKTGLENKLALIRNYSIHRLNLFRKCRWTKREYPLSALGTVLPECGDLPIDIIVQPFSQIVEYVRERLKKPNQGTSIRYIEDLINMQDILKIFPPIIVEPASLQREIGKLESFYKVYGKDRWKIFEGEGYIEDGNHRAIAMVIAYDLNAIPCYVGQYFTSRMSEVVSE